MLHLPRHDGGTRLVLVRHLNPDESVRDRAHGALDEPLAPAARRRVELLARQLEVLPFAAVYSSPLRRARETAAPIAARHGLVPVAHDGLREIEFGELEGRPYEEIEVGWPELFRSWMEEPTCTRFPGGESFADLRARVLAASDEIRLRHTGATIAIVAHGGVTRTVLAAALAMPDEALFRLDQSYGGVSVVDWLSDVPLVRLVNATAFA
jgi:broad specificity phosphatase PhoE